MNSLPDQRQNEKAVRLVDYLLRLASLRAKLVRDIADYDRTLWLSAVPHEKGCFTQAWGRHEDYDPDVWVEVQNQREPDLPIVPDPCKDWIDKPSLRNKNDLPELLPEITRQVKNPAWQQESDQPEYILHSEHLADHPEVERSRDRYIEERWLPWVEAHNVWESIHKVYSDLFAIHQEQLRLGEEYELVLALGLLTWQTPSGQRVRRHLIVANALLEFEASSGKFTVRPNSDGASLRPELDMLDIEEQPARAEETAKSSLANAVDDPWETNCTEGVLKALVHSISPQGEYENALAAKSVRATAKPIVEYAPALVLRKRSARGLTEILKRIKERIEKGEDIPSEFGDLAEVPPSNGTDSCNGSGESNSGFDGEVFFPKPSNEEQRCIVDKLRGASGVLVQGPPGTGKSHTIANLICHLLATGQRILVTAKTPRALQVLMGRFDKDENENGKKDDGLIPKEIRPLCISLLGSGLEEKRSLESSVGGILSIHDEWNENQATRERENLAQKLRGLREEKANVDRRLRDIRESETHAQSIAEGTYRGTAARIAQAVNRNRSAYNWFTDTAPLDKSCPISESDLSSVLAALRRFTPEKRRELSLAWPDALPSPDRFAKFVESEKGAIEEESISKRGAEEQIADRLSKVDVASIRAISDTLSAFQSAHRRLSASTYSWMQEALRDVMCGNPSLWRELCRVTRDITTSIEPLIPIADDTRIDFPNEANLKTLLEDICKLKNHMENGGKLGWGPFRPKLVKERGYVIKGVRVDGTLCSNVEHFSVLADALRVHVECEKAWGFWVGRCEKVQGPYTLQLQALTALCDALAGVLQLEDLIEQCGNALMRCPSLAEPLWADESQVEKVIASCRLALARLNKERATGVIRDIETPVVAVHAKNNEHPMVSKLLEAIRKRDIDGFARFKVKFEDLQNEHQYIQKVDEYVKKLHHLVPKLIEALEFECNASCWDACVQSIREAWHWAQARFWVEEYISKEDTPSLVKRMKQIEDEINDTIARLAALHAWSFCFSRLKESHRRNMKAWQKNVDKITKSGTGKQDFFHRKEAQKNLNNCREAIPAWVMPLHRVWDTVDPEPSMFDVIIVDEASQCGFEALPLFYMAKKIIIVGDDKQISPEAEGVKLDAVTQLISQFLFDFEHKASFNINRSLFDHGELRYSSNHIVLREHFRCMPEIIRFSNDLCYRNTPLIPLRQYGPDRLIPLKHVFVNGGYREGAGSQVVNRPEADAIVETIVELCKDDRLSRKTMGVVVLQGEFQAGLIEAQLLEHLGAEEMESRRLVCGNPYSFQGDERDIMFLSMVAAPNERIGPLVKAADERRFNVAASRARDQMYLFHSVTCDDLSSSCLRRKLLEFFENTKPQEIAGINRDELERRATQDNRGVIKPPTPFESWFEVDVALELLRKGFIVLSQHEVAGKRIDLVVEGGQARLAVECDGDDWHGADRYEADMQRQRMLERCRWEFFRIRGSAFYSNKENALQGLWEALEERGIFPFSTSGKDEQQTPMPSGETEGDYEDNDTIEIEESDRSSEGPAQAIKIRVGSMVFYANEDDGIKCQAQITTDRSNPEWGIINANTPIAKALLGAEVGHVVIAYLPVGPARLKVVDIR